LSYSDEVVDRTLFVDDDNKEDGEDARNDDTERFERVDDAIVMKLTT
jgi:hypothetical protein